jgi:hypothetical protein
MKQKGVFTCLCSMKDQKTVNSIAFLSYYW